MARKKKHTLEQTANKKLSRREQLAQARKKRKIESGRVESTANQPIDTENDSTPATACTVTVGLGLNQQQRDILKESEVLGQKTRSQYKVELAEVAVNSACDKIRDNDKSGVSSNSSSNCDQCSQHCRAIVDIEEFNKFLIGLNCTLCSSNSLCMRSVEKKRKGLAVFCELFCSNCEEVLYSGYLANQADKSGSTGGERPFIVNKQCVCASLACGLGATTLNNFCELMGLQGMHPSTFHMKANELYKDLEQFEHTVFSQAVTQVRNVNAALSGITLTDDTVLDVTVSYDGSWLTRGHSSHVGVGCVVDVVTGLCIDAHTMSTYCQTCETTGKRLLQDKPLEHAAWAVKHLASCDKNYQGSSGMMEVEAARVLWTRSVSRHKLRFISMLSDGDSKTLKTLNETVKPYGDDFTIDKEECVNHVGKRLGTALRNVVTDCKKRGVTLGGRGKGRLTQDAIRKLQIYYNRAIKGKDNVTEMKKAVNASLYHGFSTDNNPQHQFCPPGVDSWCFFQAAIAEHRVPGPHDKLVRTPLDFNLLSPHIFPIYERLTDDQLMQRCARGRTQNANECLHSTIWARCAKDQFACRRRVRFALVTAVGEFNFGHKSSKQLLNFYGLRTSQHMDRLGAARTAKRVRNSLKREQDKQENRREKRRIARQKRLEQLMVLEGGPAYGAGMF